MDDKTTKNTHGFKKVNTYKDPLSQTREWTLFTCGFLGPRGQRKNVQGKRKNCKRIENFTHKNYAGTHHAIYKHSHEEQQIKQAGDTQMHVFKSIFLVSASLIPTFVWKK